MRPRLCSISRSRRMVISELEYFRASSRTRARPFWLTKSTMARRRSSFSTAVRLFGMVAYDHIQAKKQEQPPNCRSAKQKAAADLPGSAPVRLGHKNNSNRGLHGQV